uniref:VLRF1 domain-containing protein n=1 Tax=Arundo donax TaxID=35708 RepID=A0A0A9CTC3_ARUDO
MAAASPERRPPRSLFDLPSDFFDSSVLLRAHPSSAPSAAEPSEPSLAPQPPTQLQQQTSEAAGFRWTCNTCATEFESLQEQREHFKSDLHRLNVKLSIAGKTIIKEEDLDKADSDSLFDDLEISSVSGSEDELENGPATDRGLSVKGKEEFRKKIYFHRHLGDTISFWRCILLKEHEEPFFDCKSGQMESTSCVQEDEVINRVKHLTCEPRDASHLRIVLLTSGGHFAGCVFDGNSIVAHKTFHRYVVRAKAGKRQSGKDATGKVAHSAGSSLRRHNEAALKKEVQELILSWKSYFDICVCAFIYAPSKNRQMLFDGDKIQSVLQACDIRPIPLTVHRPTLKEAKRVYSNLTRLYYETECSVTDEVLPHVETVISPEQSQGKKKEVVMGSEESISDLSVSLESLKKNEAATIPSSKNETTALHEAAKSGNVQLTLELLEQGSDPCIRDARGKTPYMLTSDKEVRNTFRRFMALNLDKWDWHAADVPSALTKEMEESQAAKQAEKDAKKKARAKELKKLKKAREKEEKEKEKAKAQASQSQTDVRGTSTAQMGNRTASVPGLKPKHQTLQLILMAKEEERQNKLAEEREKRAAAAERRLAALAAQSGGTSGAAAAAAGPAQRAAPDDNACSCCFSSLAGKVPFHRYNYKYCSTTCMHLHSEMLDED